MRPPNAAPKTPEVEAKADMGLSIDIAVEHDAWASLGDVEGLAERAVAAAITEARLEPAEDAELSIVLCDDAFIQGLNKQWRGKDKPTNVLSFPSAEAARTVALGDIIVAYETSAREAAERATPLADYFTHLVVHGFLHLFGYDHEDDRDATTMEALESRTLARLGLPSPYEDAEDLRATQ